jgi:hypothetical protein
LLSAILDTKLFGHGTVRQGQERPERTAQHKQITLVFATPGSSPFSAVREDRSMEMRIVMEPGDIVFADIAFHTCSMHNLSLKQQEHTDE